MALRLIGCLRSRSQWAAGLVQAISTAGVSQSRNYERLEYLGDAWLKYVAVAKVYNRYVGQRWVLLNLALCTFWLFVMNCGLFACGAERPQSVTHIRTGA
jgi:hypothetical protein